MSHQKKSRPIIFNSEMVNAILDGRKTQTRRVLKPQPPSNPLEQDGKKWGKCDGKHFFCDIKFPYGNGKVGDRLWVRETWCLVDDTEYEGDKWIDYKATPKYSSLEPAGWDSDPNHPDALKWKSSVHMPRWASRITLEITSIRVERLQDISDDDCLAEGIFFTDYGKKCYHSGYGDVETCPSKQGHTNQQEGWFYGKTNSPRYCLGSAKMAFANLSYKSKINWDQNPFVWVIGFKEAGGE